MESFEDLRLEKKDKIQKRGFLERFFKKESNISEENLDFLEERYQSTKEQDISQNKELQEILTLQNTTELQYTTNVLDENEDFRFIELQNTELTGVAPFKIESQNANGDSNGTSLETDEKEEVLSLELNANEIQFKMVLVAFVCMAAVLLLFVPKVYIRSNIYYASRNMIQLQAQIDSLSEENKHIKKQLEDIKFRNLTQLLFWCFV